MNRVVSIPELSRRDFTIDRDPRINRVIAEHTHEIARVIEGTAGDDVLATYLVGGFGRGEGSVRLSNGRIHVVNDYDLLVVCPSRRSKGAVKIADLEPDVDRLAGELGVKQIDIMVESAARSRLPIPTVNRYEVANGRVFLGGHSKRWIGSVPPRYLPLLEGTRYFFCRGSGLLIARLLLDGAGSFDPGTRAEYVKIELVKAGLAIGDVALIAQRRYHYSYEERLKRVERSQVLTEREISAYRSAVDWKLRPDTSDPQGEDLDVAFYRAVNMFLSYFRRFESQRTGRSINDWEEYDPTSQPRRVSQRLAAMAFRDRSRQMMRRAMALLLLYQLSPKETLLDKVDACLGAESTGITGRLRWRECTQRYLTLWHPGGVVKSVTSESLESFGSVKA